MNKKIALAVRNASCEDCKLHRDTEDVCETGDGPTKATIMVVGKMPNSGNYQAQLETELIAAGFDISQIFFSAALKCKSYNLNASASDIKACSKYLQQEIALVQPKWILTFGNEALRSVTGHSGITKWRGQVIEKQEYKVFATLAHASVIRNPGQKAAWVADLTYFKSLTEGRTQGIEAPKIKTIDTTKKLKKLMKLLDIAELLSYDIETNGFDEFAEGAKIVSLSGTMKVGKKIIVWALPLAHPESPFRNSWRSVLRHLGPHLERVPKQIAHNGKFDARWQRQFGVRAIVTFDTMVAAHLLDENRLKGLKPLARVLLGVPPWEIPTGDLMNTPLDQVLEYNALDTYYTYHIYKILRKQLIKQPRLLRIFQFILMPANEEFIEAERYGVWVDDTKLTEAIKISFAMRDEIDKELSKYVPKPDVTTTVKGKKLKKPWPTKGRTTKLMEVNWNPSNFARWFLFDYMKFPVHARGKEKDDGGEGDPSMAEDVMLELNKLGHPVITLLMERTKWQKYCSTYVIPYQMMKDENDRIHTSFKLTGTVTGRISSGKEEVEKLSGSARGTLRGVNLQQVPRDPFIRGIFGAPEDYFFVEADYSQVELRWIAFVSRDRTMMGMYQRGEDIHRYTAARVLGIPESQVSSDDRKKAKAVNFGYAYGMGPAKFVDTAFTKYGSIFSLDEASDVRKQFFGTFQGLLPWHQRQRRLVNANARVQSPIGRIRHLPDIRSQDPGVRAEAERQAINSPIQSIASDVNLWAMTIIAQEFRKLQLNAHVLGTVHDAINFEIHGSAMKKALPIIKNTMENLPLEKYFGLVVDVPMVADLKVGHHWGGAKEVPVELVERWDEKWLSQ